MPVLVGLVAFLSEIALLIAAAIGGWRLAADAGTAAAVVLAVGLPLLVAAAWGAWLAPRARWRLRDPARLAAKCLVFAAAGVLLATAGLPGWGVGLAVVGSAAAVAGRWYAFPGHDDPGGARPDPHPGG